MTAAPTSPAPEGARPRRSLTTAAAFLVGLPLAAGILALVHFGPLRASPVARYLSHTVECVEVVMFCVALGALGAKLWLGPRERRACRAEVLPPWDGKPLPVGEATKLLAGVTRLPGRLRDTSLVNRVAGVLDFLGRRGSAAELDDQMRDLADADRDALEGSYALIRFITWAIPILGFLGTVLGITGAISGVTPERLEQDLNSVTDGLALAFDSTALALGLTMLTMFLTYCVERLEGSVLEEVDRYAARHLAHRFRRAGAEASGVAEVVQASATAVLEAAQQLVERQAAVWAKALEEIDRRRAAVEGQQAQRLTAALEAALDRTLYAHGERLAGLEKQAAAQAAGLMELVAEAVTALGRQQAALTHTAEGVHAQAAVLARLHEDERHLIRLQETLANNLQALSGAGAFEEAVHSLTAAVHLLTARAAGSTFPAVKRPGVAA